MPFITPLDARLVDHLANSGGGEWELLAPLVYEDEHGITWRVPAGFRTDFASVPRIPLAYLVAGNTAHAPAALHDWLLEYTVVSRPEADRLFREAMESIGMPSGRVAAMFQAVSARTRQLLGFGDGPG